MKKVILSSDGDSVLYLVPDVVADDLEAYCLEFCSNWLCHSPDAKNIEKKVFCSILKVTLLII